MKNIAILMLLLFIFSCSPSGNEINEKLFKNIWQAYVTMEFEESFYEKLSIVKKGQFIEEIAQRAEISAENIEYYMKQNHPDKYKRVYLDN